MSLGGPIQKDKVWIFGAYRRAFIDSTVDRSPADVQAFEAFAPDLLGDFPANQLHSHQPFVKVTSRSRRITSWWACIQYDRMRQQSVRSNEAKRTTRDRRGRRDVRRVAAVHLWHDRHDQVCLQLQQQAGQRPRPATSRSLIDLGVPVSIFQSTTLNQGIPTGVGNIFNEGGYGTMAIEKSSYSMIRGDVTWFKQEGLGGSHEFQTGFLLMPRNYYKGTNIVIDPSGLTAESVRLRDPNNINSGTVPFSTHVRDERARDRQHGGARP